MILDKGTFIKRYVSALDKQSAAIFAGSGLSMSQGFVNWAGLLKDAAEEIGLNVEKEQHDLVTLAQYYKNRTGGRGLLNQMITEEFGKKVHISENHKILAKLPIDTYWTTNYDTLIEDALRHENKNPSVKITKEDLANTLPEIDATVYKMHGDVNRVANTVITRDDYDRYDHKYSLFKETLEGNLLTKTFLFIGFSFSDPNLERILARIRIVLEENQRPHYCIMKKIVEEDFIIEGQLDEEKYQYEKIKRILQIEDLKRFSIHVVEIDDYPEITSILMTILKEYQKKTVFISGSAETYDPMDRDKAEYFLETLSRRLIDEGYRIVSGFGVGVGSYVINGVLKQRFEKSIKSLGDKLILKPFPQNSKELWHKYREDIISDIGSVIFVFGNKKDKAEDNIVNADGVRKEFEIARKCGKCIVPVGFTGYESKLIYEEMMSHFENFYSHAELKTKFEKIEKYDSNDSIDAKIDSIIDILKTI